MARGYWLLAALLPLTACGGGGDESSVGRVVAVSTTALPRTTVAAPATTLAPATTEATTTTLATTTTVEATTTAPPTTLPPTPPPTEAPPPPPPPPPAAKPAVPRSATVKGNRQTGTIWMPTIGVSVPMVEGVDDASLNLGAGHWPGTAMPGQLGNSVIAGHRVSHTKPFRNIDKLQPGDEVIFETADGTFTYHVTRLQIINPDDTWIVNPTPDATATLFACHPPGSTRQRIVAFLKLQG